MKCPARGKKCLTCNEMNHFAKCCRMKGKEDKGVLKAVEKDSDSSDAESLCGIEKVGAVKHNQGRRSISSVIVENREFQVLVDTGTTVNVMDQITFKRLLADKEIVIECFACILIERKHVGATEAHGKT